MTIDDALNRDLSWAEATFAWVKTELGPDASLAVTIDTDGYRQETKVTRDRDGDVLWVEHETNDEVEDETTDVDGGDYLVAADEDGNRIFEGEPEQFWASLRGWAQA
jgi:hypothetical protein